MSARGRLVERGAAPATREVSDEGPRCVAVRTQRLDGSTRGALGTIRHLGFIQLDPIAVATPQELVLRCPLGRTAGVPSTGCSRRRGSSSGLRSCLLSKRSRSSAR